MMPDQRREPVLSAAFFCPQSKAPTEDYLIQLHSFLRGHQHGQALLEEVAGLPETWTLFANAKDSIRALSHGLRYVNMLVEWAKSGLSAPLAEARSGIVALPLLIILQIGQYLCYLEVCGLSHASLIKEVCDVAGLQGYCAGLPTAIAIACSEDEAAVIRNAATVMRILLGVGAYGEAADDSNPPGSTTLALRLKHENQGSELAQLFPGTYVSAITDAKSISMVGPAQMLVELYAHAQGQGLAVQKMDIRGKVHNPENKALATDLCNLCARTTSLQLPEASRLQVPVRSNVTGERLSEGSLTKEIVTTILASKCDWNKLLTHVAEDLDGSGRVGHSIVTFGMNDCVPMGAFHKKRLSITKLAAHSLIQKAASSITQNPGSMDSSIFSEDAIAIIGASCRLPGANNIDELWAVLSHGLDCHREIATDRFNLYESFRTSQSGNFVQGRKFFGNFLDNPGAFDNSFFGINAREAINMDPQQRLLLELSYEALEASGYLSSHCRDEGDHVGCFVGASLVEYLDNTNSHGPTAYTSTGTIRAFLCGRLSYYYGWSGPSEVIDTACSSSLVAINRACKAIQTGECSMALAGGVNVITGINNYLDLGKAGFLSPSGQCKPFDQSADGYCRSDGAGLVVLKNLAQAISNGDQIMGVIPGVATNQGGLSASITVPSPTAQEALYSAVLRQAGLQPGQITYVEAHGPGTPAGDPIEMKSIRSVFGNRSRSDILYVGSIKGNIGHCETAAGVAGLLKVLAMLKYGKIPPQANHRQLNPNIPPLGPDRMEISRDLCDWLAPLRTALVTSYGAAGSNCALLCCEIPVLPSPIAQLSSYQQSGLTLPILLTAATSSSLFRFIRKLAAYLRQEGPKLRMCDVAFTLNERRRRYKYGTSVIAKDLPSLVSALESHQSSFLEYPQCPKPVVLVFSGQNSSTVSLDKTIYEKYAVFRTHITECDLVLRNLGYESLFPAIFRPGPISDVVLLQCCIFAVQYACARSWITAGLKIEALVGHSFGELTALAVSEVLSLADSIKLIAFRAHLTNSKWGSERGAMLAIHATPEEVQKLVTRLQQGSEGMGLEIACYNASSSLVVVGATATISAAETLLQTDVSFQKIRFQRLNASHGFHSSLTDFMLADLENMSKSLQWRTPRIPIEACTKQHLDSIQNFSVSKHAREPVFFANAIRRVEDRLGPCIWFEAGIDTPIIPMAQKALRTPGIHDFQSFSLKKVQVPVNAVATVISKMWHSGVFMSHWDFLPVQNRVYKQVWLPPYQFDTPPHWLANIDRPSEILQNLPSQSRAELQESLPTPPPALVTRKESMTKIRGLMEFRINIECQRFQELVGGHAVRQRPLCPASMYMECATMAIQIVLGKLGEASLAFEELVFQAALGLDRRREVVLVLEELAATQSWKFAIQSSIPVGSKPRTLTHARGKVALVSEPRLDPFRRLIGDAIGRLDRNLKVEKLLKKRAYGLFAQVVHYEHFFQGITTITLDESEAVATLQLPQNQPGRTDSTAWSRCDTPTVDTFIQVVGLLMNSSDTVCRDEVMVAVGIDRVMLSSACDMDDSKIWRVYARFSLSQESHPIGDVFVCSQEGEMVAMLSGCHFTKLLVSKLEKMLDSANSIESLGREPPFTKVASVPKPISRGVFTPVSESNASQTAFTDAEATLVHDVGDATLRRLIADFTGLLGSDIVRDCPLAELGLDSLASVEMVEELSARFGLVITSDELVKATLGTLTQRLSGSSAQEVVADHRQAGRGDLMVTATVSEPSLGPSEQSKPNPQQHQQLFRIIADASGVEPRDMQEQHTLADLGVDSLSAIDMVQQIEEVFSIQLESSQPILGYTVKELMQLLGLSNLEQPNIPLSNKTIQATESLSSLPFPKQREGVFLQSPFEALIRTEASFEMAANEHGFLRYWTNVAPLQNKLLLAYILDGFRYLGVNLSAMQPGSKIPSISHLAKYDRLMQRLWDILASHDVIVKQSNEVLRGSGSIDVRSSAQLYEAFVAQHPRYEPEAKLMGLTGSSLVQCLTGEIDPISLMFAKPASLKIMENFYGQSPMMSTLTEQLVAFMITLLGDVQLSGQAPVRILEVGAGTGGTTIRLAEALEALGVTVSYTFTDISPSLVTKAREKLKKYAWINFATFNLEHEVIDSFRNQFDIVISANCVHATTDRTASCRRLRETLKEGGFVVLSEVTRIMDWYDICFGLLDGWWLAEGGSAYPLQSAAAWVSTLEAAGFASVNFSSGSIPEARTQQLVVGSTRKWGSPVSKTSEAEEVQHRLETMVYKEVSGVQIHADVYVPASRRDRPMPFALMIHGGGHMTLSRKAVRPAQTKHLLSHGFVPVSVDYRLCPEVNLIDGPFSDVRDAYKWIKTILSERLRSRGIVVDSEKVVVIGWSTGGHLAMSIGWTANEVFMPPPTAILSFYAPTDFASGELDVPRLNALPTRCLSMDNIRAALQTKPITNYGPHGSDATDLGWVKAGDPRSELILSLFKDGTGLPLLLNGLPSSDTESSEPISAARIAAISPLAQLCRGNYSTPTYIVHSTLDEVVPFAAAEYFVSTLSRRHVRHGFLKIEGAKHIHDLQLRPGMEAWQEQVAPGYQFLFEAVKMD